MEPGIIFCIVFFCVLAVLIVVSGTLGVIYGPVEPVGPYYHGGGVVPVPVPLFGRGYYSRGYRPSFRHSFRSGRRC